MKTKSILYNAFINYPIEYAFLYNIFYYINNKLNEKLSESNTSCLIRTDLSCYKFVTNNGKFVLTTNPLIHIILTGKDISEIEDGVDLLLDNIFFENIEKYSIYDKALTKRNCCTVDRYSLKKVKYELKRKKNSTTGPNIKQYIS